MTYLDVDQIISGEQKFCDLIEDGEYLELFRALPLLAGDENLFALLSVKLLANIVDILEAADNYDYGDALVYLEGYLKVVAAFETTDLPFEMINPHIDRAESLFRKSYPLAAPIRHEIHCSNCGQQTCTCGNYKPCDGKLQRYGTANYFVKSCCLGQAKQTIEKLSGGRIRPEQVKARAL